MIIQNSNINLNSNREFINERSVKQVIVDTNQTEQTFNQSKDVYWQQSNEVASTSVIQDATTKSQATINAQALFTQVAHTALDSTINVNSFLEGDARGAIGFMMSVQNEEQLNNDEALMQVNVHTETVIREEEKTQFAATGNITLESGEQIDFMLNLSMQRQFESTDISDFDGQKKWLDPLVINFEGGAPEFKNTIFEFDLNKDGEKDQLKQTQSGTGFIVFDKNQNGTIDDGNEMFGPQTGSGFEDLSIYDDDQNGWIDENDAIYSQLQVLSFNEDKEVLSSFKDLDIGAIYLGSASSEFALTDQNNDSYGQIKSTGIALKENGQTLIVQEMDFAIEKESEFEIAMRETGGFNDIRGLDLIQRPVFGNDFATITGSGMLSLATPAISNVSESVMPRLNRSLNLQNNQSNDQARNELENSRQQQKGEYQTHNTKDNVKENIKESSQTPPQTNSQKTSTAPFEFKFTAPDVNSSQLNIPNPNTKTTYDFEHKLDPNRFLKEQIKETSIENNFGKKESLLMMINTLKENHQQYQLSQKKMEQYKFFS